jgi:hypothetical protein
MRRRERSRFAKATRSLKCLAMQALIRSMFRAAAQGDSKTGRQLLEMIARAESARATFAKEFLENAFRYKEEFGPKFDQRERDGLEPLEIYPHPDDIVIDGHTGEVTIDGPMSKEEAGAQKVVTGHALNSLIRYFEVEAALAQHPIRIFLKKPAKETYGVRRPSKRVELCKLIRLNRSVRASGTRTARNAQDGSGS